jgi:dihydropteroate synthase
MAAVNVSPESFYKGSVATTGRQISAEVRKAIEGGAAIIDIGGMSTSPYLMGEVSEEVEAARVRAALRAIVELVGDTPISVDTLRSSVADMALRNGACVVNDVSGLKNDPGMGRVIRDRGASLLAMAHSSRNSAARPIPRILGALQETLTIAEEAGIDRRAIVLDPGIGFFREQGLGLAYSPQRLMPWYEWDLEVIASLARLNSLGRPIGVGLSRKSFIGKILKTESPDDRLPGSLAATAIAVMNGASLIRSHDVKETVQAVRIAEAVVKRVRRSTRAS